MHRRCLRLNLAEPALVARGASCFRAHRNVCHGAPGFAPSPVGLAMQPLPRPLVCHVIPGMVGTPRHIGSSLAGYGLRTTIKGHLPNTTENLLAWIRDPQGIDPGSAMPTTRIGEADAHAIVAYPQGLR